MTASTPATPATPKERAAKSISNLNKGRSKGLTKPRLNTPGLPHLINIFLQGSTAKDAAEESGVSRPVVNRFIKSLRQRGVKCMYISSWDVDRGYTLPVYTLGYGSDRTKPKPQKSRRYRQKQKHLNLIHLTAGSPLNTEDNGNNGN